MFKMQVLLLVSLGNWVASWVFDQKNMNSMHLIWSCCWTKAGISLLPFRSGDSAPLPAFSLRKYMLVLTCSLTGWQDRVNWNNSQTDTERFFFIASGREYLINKSWKLNKLFFHATIFYHCSDEYLFMASWLIIMVHSFQAWLWMDRLTNSLFNWVIWTQTQCLPRWVVWLTGVSISANQTKHTTRKHIYPHSYIYIQNAYF